MPLGETKKIEIPKYISITVEKFEDYVVAMDRVALINQYLTSTELPRDDVLKLLAGVD